MEHIEGCRFWPDVLGAISFNQNLSPWHVSHALFNQMFDETEAFDQPLSNWNASNAELLDYMFWSASVFDGEGIAGWDVSGVFSMKGMFQLAPSFNQDLSNWDLVSTEYLDGMFEGAWNFNQNLCSWGLLPLLSNATVDRMFQGTLCPTYDDPNLTSNPQGPFCHPCS